ncbi:hypothetical protein XarbCFBP8132_20760 [Xanthomonas arboricola]|uniref:hypothetical protein n=1 Tax=Xanthomonas arboricola TaxID=56448 RepID=UPI000CEEC5C5|nr:hypothetical protein [Xanthomonas arboricola]PPT35162.1 hypothetical protein XarbCFBP8132_20760 [Xanthomonas arboricola]
MATPWRKALIEAIAKMIILFLLWFISVAAIIFLDFNWARTARVFFRDTLSQEPIFLALIASVVLGTLLLTLASVLALYERIRGVINIPDYMKYAIEMSADLADNLGTPLALFSLSAFTLFVSNGDPFHLFTSVYAFFLAYALVSYGKRFAV